MWIIQEPKEVALWNKRHFEEKNGECAACLKYSVLIVVEKKYIKCNIWKVAVRPSYIWNARFLKVNVQIRFIFLFCFELLIGVVVIRKEQTSGSHPLLRTSTTEVCFMTTGTLICPTMYSTGVTPAILIYKITVKVITWNYSWRDIINIRTVHMWLQIMDIIFVVCLLLGNSPASEFYKPTFRNTLSVPSS
jgi:hypothetical protein